MRSIHTEEELIFSFPASEYPKLAKFLHSYDLADENDDILHAWHKKDQPPSGVWPIELEEQGRFILVIGKEEGHIFLKKSKAFEKLRDKFLEFLQF